MPIVYSSFSVILDKVSCHQSTSGTHPSGATCCSQNSAFHLTVLKSASPKKSTYLYTGRILPNVKCVEDISLYFFQMWTFLECFPTPPLPPLRKLIQFMKTMAIIIASAVVTVNVITLIISAMNSSLQFAFFYIDAYHKLLIRFVVFIITIVSLLLSSFSSSMLSR